MSSINSYGPVQPLPPPPPPPVENPIEQDPNLYGPQLPNANELEPSVDASGATSPADTAQNNPAKISADNHPVASLDQWKSPQNEVVIQPDAASQNTSASAADDATQAQPGAQNKPDSSASIGDISGGPNAKFEQAPPNDLWSSATRAVSNFTNGMVNGRPGASDGTKVDTSSLSEMERFSVLPGAMQAGVNVRETYDRLSTAMDKGLTSTQQFGNDLANRDLMAGVDTTKLAETNELADGSSGNLESYKIGANWGAKVVGEGIDVVASLGKGVGSVINGVPKWASDATGLATGGKPFDAKEAGAAVFSGVSKIGYGMLTGLVIDLPSRVLSPGEGHDAAAKAIGETQKSLDDSYKGDLRKAGVNPDSATYKTWSSATEVLGTAATFMLPGAKGAGKVTAVEKGGALVKAEAPGALVKTKQSAAQPATEGGALVKAEPPGALVKTNSAKPQTGAPQNTSPARPVEVEVLPPEAQVSKAKTIGAGELAKIRGEVALDQKALSGVESSQKALPSSQMRTMQMAKDALKLANPSKRDVAFAYGRDVLTGATAQEVNLRQRLAEIGNSDLANRILGLPQAQIDMYSHMTKGVGTHAEVRVFDKLLQAGSKPENIEIAVLRPHSGEDFIMCPDCSQIIQGPDAITGRKFITPPPK